MYVHRSFKIDRKPHKNSLPKILWTNTSLDDTLLGRNAPCSR